MPSSDMYPRESTPISRVIWDTLSRAAMSWSLSGVSMPYQHGPVMGGDDTRMCTSRAPALRISATSPRVVVPRTIESSTITTLLPSRISRTGLY